MPLGAAWHWGRHGEFLLVLFWSPECRDAAQSFIKSLTEMDCAGLVANQQNYSNFLTNSPSLHFLKDYLMCWKCPFSLNCSITLVMNLFIPRVLVFIFIFLILFFKPMQPSEVFCYFFVWLFFGTSFGFLASGSCQWWCGQCCCGVLHVASL